MRIKNIAKKAFSMLGYKIVKYSDEEIQLKGFRRPAKKIRVVGCLQKEIIA